MTTPNCIICQTPYEGMGHNPQPIAKGRCCSACNDALVIPLRMGQHVARDAAERVAQYALALARQRARLAPTEPARVKDMALMAATALATNAVEREYMLTSPVHRVAKGFPRVS